jgi:hypothetical protein
MSDAALHPLCAPLAPLLGSWWGSGEGDYPSIDAFDYGEELTFTHVGKPFVVMVQRTRLHDSGAPSHTETGYLRPQEDDTVELVIAQPSGVLASHVGSVTRTDDGMILELESVGILLSPSAKSVTATRRRFIVERDTMINELEMAAVGIDMTHHVRAELRRA